MAWNRFGTIMTDSTKEIAHIPLANRPSVGYSLCERYERIDCTWKVTQIAAGGKGPNPMVGTGPSNRERPIASLFPRPETGRALRPVFFHSAAARGLHFLPGHRFRANFRRDLASA